MPKIKKLTPIELFIYVMFVIIIIMFVMFIYFFIKNFNVMFPD